MSVISCTHKRSVTAACYFWRTSDVVRGPEMDILRRQQIHTLYTKILDIDWDGENGAIPVASLNIEDQYRALNLYDSLRVQLIPVVFITNKTFTRIDSIDIPQLALRVVRRCLPAYDSIDIAYEARQWIDRRASVRPEEIQIDCDWTVSTAGKYFYFLQTIRKLLPSDSIRLSATIRLHQYKYPAKTGVPPVDRGMLMLYNVGDLTTLSPSNSIFDREKAAAYFTDRKPYPLPLDIALPCYSWGLIFRNKKFYQIENGLDAEELRHHPAFAAEPRLTADADNTATGVSLFRVTKDTVFKELFLRPGDEIKIESIDSGQLTAAAGLARLALNTDSFRIAFFDLSSNQFKKISDETLTHIYTAYR